MDGGARMSGGGFSWSTFWMGDVMSFRLEKNHGTAGAIDRGQISVQVLVHAVAIQNIIA
jgi:hypothetical protein